MYDEGQTCHSLKCYKLILCWKTHQINLTFMMCTLHACSCFTVKTFPCYQWLLCCLNSNVMPDDNLWICCFLHDSNTLPLQWYAIKSSMSKKKSHIVFMTDENVCIFQWKEVKSEVPPKIYYFLFVLIAWKHILDFLSFRNIKEINQWIKHQQIQQKTKKEIYIFMKNTKHSES